MLQSAKVSSLVIKPFIEDGMRDYHSFKVSSTQASQLFVWFINLYGESLGSYLTIALQNKDLKYHRPGYGHFKVLQ